MVFYILEDELVFGSTLIDPACCACPYTAVLNAALSIASYLTAIITDFASGLMLP